MADTNFNIPIDRSQIKTPADIDTSFNGPVPKVDTSSISTQAKQKGGNEPSKFSNFMNSQSTKIGLEAIGAVASAFPSLNKSTNSLDQGITAGREAVAGALMKSGNPWAMAAGATVMAFSKTGGFTNASKGLGGATDTFNGIAAFALPGAGYFTPKTRSIEKNPKVMASSGYGGVTDVINKASDNANAKLLFGRGKANSMINKADSIQAQTSRVLQTAENRSIAAANPLYSTAVQNQNMSSNITPNTFMAAKKGAKLYNTDFAKKVLSYQKGKQIIKTEDSLNTTEMKDRFIDPSVIDTYESWLENLAYEPDHTKYDYKTAYESLEPHILLNHLINPEKHHLGSVALLPDGRYTFLKLGREDLTDPNNTVIKELDFYNAPENEEFRNNYNLEFSDEDNRYYYIPKNNIDSFKKGGAFNVIPEGALHKNKHHLSDIDEKFNKVTSKGIPVITESEGGKVVQHAEVEKEEWTIRLEVTEQIEDYLEEYNKSEKQSHKNLLAFAAGELILEELLYNTKDNSGLIDKIE